MTPSRDEAGPAGAGHRPAPVASGEGAPPPAALYAEYADATPVLEPAAPRGVGGILAGPLTPAILRLAGPAVGTTLFQVLFNVTDLFWVGRTLGATAIAGVSVASYAIWIMTSIGEVVGVGLTAVAARRHGEGRPAAAAEATGIGLALALAIGLLVSAAGLLTLPALMAVMRVDADVAREASRFLGVQYAGAVLVYGYFVVGAAFRSAGDTRTPFVLLGTSVLLNLVLDPILIVGWGPIPALGVFGAGLATVLTRGLACVAGLWLLWRRGAITRGRGWRVGATILRIGTPTMLTGVLFSLVYVWLARITGAFGAEALAALGIGHKIEGVSYMACIGFALAAETMVGQNLGAGQPDRARRAGWTTVRLATAVTALCGLAFQLVPEQLAGIFTEDADVIRLASGYLRAVAVGQLFLSLETVLEGALSGAGHTLWPNVWIIVFSLVRIPLAAPLAARFGLDGLWWMIAATGIARGIALAWLWQRRGWEGAEA